MKLKETEIYKCNNNRYDSIERENRHNLNLKHKTCIENG